MLYFAEFNRVVGDNIRLAARRLSKIGVDAQTLPHQTAMVIKKPKGMPWKKFKSVIASILHPKRGSVMIHSEKTGHTYICSNRGNRPGCFVRQ